MKGLTFSISILIIFLGSLLLVSVFLSKAISHQRDLTSISASDYLSYIYSSIQNDIKRIYGREANITAKLEENETHAFVTITQKLPIENQTQFQADLNSYKKFAEQIVDNITLNISVSVPDVSTKIIFEIYPYNITYEFADTGQRQVSVTPENTPNSLGKLAAYLVYLDIINNFEVGFGSWSPLKLEKPGCIDCYRCSLSVYIQVNDTTTSYADQKNLYPCGFSQNKVDLTPVGYFRARIGEATPGKLVAELQGPTESKPIGVFKVVLILEKLPGTEVKLIGSTISVKDEKFKIEKTGSVLMA